MKKMRKIGKTWTSRVRKINGKRRLVKVRKKHGKIQIRLRGYYNSSDRGKNRKIRPRYW